MRLSSLQLRGILFWNVNGAWTARGRLPTLKSSWTLVSIWALRSGPDQGPGPATTSGRDRNEFPSGDGALQKARGGKGPVPICYYLFPVCSPKYEPEVFALVVFFFFKPVLGSWLGGAWSVCWGNCSSNPHLTLSIAAFCCEMTLSVSPVESVHMRCFFNRTDQCFAATD